MKKTMYFFLAFFLLVGSVNLAKADDGKAQKALTTEQQIRVEQITKRVEEIQHMDRSNLSHEQKKELRKELTQMKGEARAISNGGIYLSLTAILIIIILLLIL